MSRLSVFRVLAGVTQAETSFSDQTEYNSPRI
jgi:hypothetical protein